MHRDPWNDQWAQWVTDKVYQSEMSSYPYEQIGIWGSYTQKLPSTLHYLAHLPQDHATAGGVPLIIPGGPFQSQVKTKENKPF